MKYLLALFAFKPRNWATVGLWLAFIFAIFGQAPVAHAADPVPPSAAASAPITWWQPILVKGASYVPNGYYVVFNDEFNGTALNRNKWATRYIYPADHLTDETQRYRDNDNHVMEAGTLSLTARKTTTGTTYESGMIRSKYEFKPTPTRSYYIEASLKMPAGKGVFSAFWLDGGVNEEGLLYWWNEIDIMEFVVNNSTENPATRPKKNMVHHNVVTQQGKIPSTLLYKDPNYDPRWGLYWSQDDLTKAFHTYGMEWTDELVTTYIDGKMISQRAYAWKFAHGGGPAPKAHVLLNLAIGGSWAGAMGIDDNAFPQSMDIDWIRVYGKESP